MSRKCLPFLLLLSLPACSTIVSGTNQSVTVSTNPPGATCSLDRNGKHLGDISPTPGSLIVSKENRPIKVTCLKDGFDTAEAQHNAGFNAMVLGNIVFGGVIGVIVDASTGAASVYPDEIKIPLAAKPPPTPQPFAAGPPTSPVASTLTNQVGS